MLSSYLYTQFFALVASYHINSDEAPTRKTNQLHTPEIVTDMPQIAYAADCLVLCLRLLTSVFVSSLSR